MKRVEFHLHTKMSIFDSISEPEEIFSSLERKNVSSFAITEHGITDSYPIINRLSKKYNISIVYGSEAFVTEGIEDIKKMVSENPDYKKSSIKYNHLILIAKNSEGIREINKMVSRSNTEFFFKMPLLPIEILESYRKKGNIIIGSACESGEVISAYLDGKPEKEIYELSKKYDFLEIQPISNSDFLVELKKINSIEDIKKINNYLYSISKKIGNLCIATSDSHMVDNKDNEIRHVILHHLGYWDYYKASPLPIWSTEEMIEEFSYLGSKEALDVVVNNSNNLFSQIDKNTELNIIIPPEIDEKIVNKYFGKPSDFIKGISENNQQAIDALKNIKAELKDKILVFDSEFEYISLDIASEMVDSYVKDINDSKNRDFLVSEMQKMISKKIVSPNGKLRFLNNLEETSDYPIEKIDYTNDAFLSHYPLLSW